MITIAVVLILAVLGVALLCGKGAFLIAGYNTMSEAEKAKYDEKKLCSAVGKLLLVLDVFLGLALWGGSTDRMAVFAVSMVLFFAAFIVGLVLVNKAAVKRS